MLLTALIVLMVMIAISIPIAAALGMLGLIMNEIYAGMPLHLAIGEIAWSNSTEFLLIAIPLFVLLGEILLRAGITEKMYEGMVQWLSWLPGGLMHSNIGSSALFAATSGSSIATAATIGTVAVPQIQKRKYNERLFLGTIAAGGTLGILIPPSINLIIYGLLTDTSVPELYLAGIFPGLILALLFMSTIVVFCMLNKSWGGEKVRTSWKQRFLIIPSLGPPMLIFGLVVGSIYAGWATPTEAASLGVMGALGLAAVNGTLTIGMLKLACEGAMRTTAMIMLIILAALFLNFVLATIGLTQALTTFIASLGLTPVQTMLLIICFYILLGCVMETLSMLITTAPLVTPIVIGLGYDPVWFGILLMVLLETALITPPIGVNLYVVHSVRTSGKMSDVIMGTLPFVGTMFLMALMLLAFPDIALWLPRMFY